MVAQLSEARVDGEPVEAGTDAFGGRVVAVAPVGQLCLQEGPLRTAYPHVVADDHHIPAQAFEQVVRRSPARYVLGLTDTPYWRDGLEGQIAMQCGKVRHTIEVDDALDDHGLTLDLQVHETDFDLDGDDHTIHQVFQALIDDDDRTRRICIDSERALENGGRCRVLTQRKGHLYGLAGRLEGHDPIVLEGGLGAPARRAATERLAAIPTSEPCLVLATGQYIGEGFDCPPLDTLFLTFPMSFKGSIVQYVGRLLRPSPDKDQVVVHDYLDSNVPADRERLEEPSEARSS